MFETVNGLRVQGRCGKLIIEITHAKNIPKE